MSRPNSLLCVLGWSDHSAEGTCPMVMVTDRAELKLMTETAPKPAPLSPLPKSVLVAEDEHLVAAGLCSQLTGLGCTVIGPVSDGRAAVHAAELHAPDFALLDIRMPVMDGLDAAQSIWQTYGIPSAVITAYSDPTYIERAQQTGVFGYLLKPATIDALRVSLSVSWARACAQSDAQKRIGQLERLLANRRIIEQAKWKLVESKKFSEPEAHVFL